jgi:cation diffusion facilitator family transporter
MTETNHRRQASRQVLLATLWLSLLVLAVKVWAGWATHSLSLLAESLHTLIDVFSTLLSLITVSSPFRTLGREVGGHGKFETSGAFFVVAFLGFAGFNLLGMSFQQLEAATHSTVLPYPVNINPQLIQLLGVVIAISLCATFFERYEARVLDSPALRLNANHMLQDAWLTILVLAGLVGVWQGYMWLDPLLAIVIVIMAVGSCWRVLNWQLPLLVRQTAIAPEALAQTARQIEGVTHCYQVQSRGIVGRHVFVKMHLVLHPEFMGAARLISERVEGAIRERYGPVQVVIQIDSDRHNSAHSLDSVLGNTPGRTNELDWN